MAIRNTAKAIILHNNKILLNRCINYGGKVYFDLPGGGQNQFETIEEAVVREVLEETGYLVKIGRFAALTEEICDSEELRMRYLDYTHRILHIFLAALADEQKREVKEMDWQQQNSLWVPLEEVDGLNFRPVNLTGKITSLISGKHTQYLGCTHFVNL
ncbi:NUDIX domain-containing protein [Oscillospiraceae bacterium LTW-04]|nr:NUDIX domain-containing protein [Oscillospiraceae bacterium MB24-C1]